jgi:molybdopterin-guanine dinucleotide biosynthesis protein A
MTEINKVTGLILAGGAGRRMDGQDKGLLLWQGKPLVSHVVERLVPQTSTLIISCNRNVEKYRSLGHPTVEDQRTGFEGPLAGIEAASSRIKTPFVAIVACDTPQLPTDLVRRLLVPLCADTESAPLISFAHDGQREQYLCALIKTECLAGLSEFMQQGHRAVKHWYRQNPHVSVDFSDVTNSFQNHNYLNTKPGQ